ncbi:MAG: PilN domain-containing protein, partial [Microcoleus sp.]
MYSLDINFLNDRPEYKPAAAAKTTSKRSGGSAKDQIPLAGALVFALGINALVMGVWWWKTSDNNSLAAEQAAAEQTLAKLQAQA